MRLNRSFRLDLEVLYNRAMTKGRPKGYKHTEESKLKMSLAMRGNKHRLGGTGALGYRHTEEAKKRIAKGFRWRGSEHHSWKGTDVKQAAVHNILRREYPKKGMCESCGKIGKTDYAYMHHPKPYTRDRNDYRELCRSCHLYQDRPKGTATEHGE